MKCIIFAAFLLCIFLPSTYSRNIQFYRKDYTYIEEFDAFYKVHWDVGEFTWDNAFLACDDEGASLFYPKTKGEWTLVKNLTNKMAVVPNVTDIFVGLHDEFKLGEFITVDGQSMPYPLPAEGSLSPSDDNCITMNIDTGLFNVSSCPTRSDTPLPFVCRKVDEVFCPTIDNGYKFLKTSRKCYKINQKTQNWNEAMKTCFMEGGILAIIENSAQAQEIKEIILNKEKLYFVGVKRLIPRGDYYTVKGKKFSDMFQNPYSNDQNQYIKVPNEYGFLPNSDGYYPDENGEYPDRNGEYRDGQYRPRAQVIKPNKDCGAIDITRDSLFTKSVSCDYSLPFICEMEVNN